MLFSETGGLHMKRILLDNGQFVPYKKSNVEKPIAKVEAKPTGVSAPVQEDTLAPLPEDLESLTAKELKVLCSERGIGFKGNSSKESLINSLRGESESVEDSL